MAMSRYDFFRKRIAPVAFLIVVALIAYDAYDKDRAERARATIVIDLGSVAPRVRTIDAELLVDGEVVGTFHRNLAIKPGELRFEARMPKEAGELRVDVDLGDARRTVVRKVDVEEGGTTTVSLGNELAR